MIYAISDLHMPIEVQIRKFNYPVDYLERVKKRLGNPELLIIAGDLSWEWNLRAGIDLLNNDIRNLPGEKKVFIAGNHDTFFHPENWRIKLLEEFNSEDLFYLSGRSIIINTSNDKKIGLSGTMGWVVNEKQNSNKDKRFLSEQTNYLKRSLDNLEEKITEVNTDKNICVLHHPPTHRIYTDGRKGSEELFNLIKEYKFINKIIYGHIHVEKNFSIFKKLDGIELYCVAIDQLNFYPVKIKI
ncbi:MAG: hypothetical protein GF329_21625 [Candidatus Lokiarchaeota archaeon]|nr:hypothetical protein [Candidatus Lokiarchaeota archaeon]